MTTPTNFLNTDVGNFQPKAKALIPSGTEIPYIIDGKSLEEIWKAKDILTKQYQRDNLFYRALDTVSSINYVVPVGKVLFISKIWGRMSHLGGYATDLTAYITISSLNGYMIYLTMYSNGVVVAIGEQWAQDLDFFPYIRLNPGTTITLTLSRTIAYTGNAASVHILGWLEDA